eukprot:1372454-Prorocentrum_lima.AAC.1
MVTFRKVTPLQSKLCGARPTRTRLPQDVHLALCISPTLQAICQPLAIPSASLSHHMPPLGWLSITAKSVPLPNHRMAAWWGPRSLVITPCRGQASVSPFLPWQSCLVAQ